MTDIKTVIQTTTLTPIEARRQGMCVEDRDVVVVEDIYVPALPGEKSQVFLVGKGIGLRLVERRIKR